MNYLCVVKKNVFPLMNDSDRVVIKNISEEVIDSNILLEQLKLLDLTIDDVDFIIDNDSEIKFLNIERDEELKKGFIFSDLFINEDIIKTMSVQHNIAIDDEVIEWIDINNQTVTFSKVDFGVLIKQGSNKIKEIYFKYRKLKDELS